MEANFYYYVIGRLQRRKKVDRLYCRLEEKSVIGFVNSTIRLRLREHFQISVPTYKKKWRKKQTDS